MRKTINPKTKVSIALKAIKGDKTINQLASEYQVHPTQVREYKARVIQSLPDLFSRSSRKDPLVATQSQLDELHRLIGLRDIELEWLKKKTGHL